LELFLLENLSALLVRKRAASNESWSLRCGIPFPASVVTVEAEQTPRRVLASRRLLFSEAGVPRLDSAPGKKRGAELKTRGMRLPLVAVCARRRLVMET